MKPWERLSLVNPDRDCASSLLLKGAIRDVRWVESPDTDRKQIARMLLELSGRLGTGLSPGTPPPLPLPARERVRQHRQRGWATA